MSDQLEANRLRSLSSYRVLDTLPEAAFDRLTSLAAELFDAPIALVSLVDEHRQWFKSHFGVETESTPRAWAFCEYAIQQEPGTTLVVQDAYLDARFMTNPLVTSDPHIRFYAGAVLTGADGHNLGTLCVIDRKPRPELTPKESQRLLTLANIVVDELELRRARFEVEEKNTLLDLAERMAGLGRWRYDVASGQISWSEEVFRIHGRSTEGGEPDLASALEVYPAADREVITRLFNRALATGEGYRCEGRVRRPNGKFRNITAKGECILDENGAVESVIGVFQDATEHVEAARFLRTVTDHMPGMIAYWDSELRCRFSNAAHMDWYGCTAEQMFGVTFKELIGASLFDQVAPFVEAVKRGEQQAFELTLTKPSGEVSHKWAYYIPDTDEAGHFKGMYVLVTDVTTLKESEQRLEQSNLLLTEARDRAEAATAVKSDFLANMSHEIRTPLTAILGFTSLLAGRSDLDETTQAHVARISGAGRGLLAIVNDILDFSKLEAGQVELKLKPSSPTDIMRDALLLFSTQAEAKGLVLEFHAEANVPACLMIDADRVRQILINLIGNAVKFTDAGSVRLAASYNHTTAQLEVQVQDTGAGMNKAQQEQLFQRFSQVDASTTRQHGGTGLGLAICRGFAEAMGGEIGVRSRPRHGSTFYVRISAQAAELAAAAFNSDEAVSLDGLRLLVVDDNPVNRELVGAILTPFGVEITEAADGLEGVEAAGGLPYDIILMDIRMPGLDGPEAAARIRDGGGPNQDVPILAFSADMDMSQHEDAGSNFDGVVRKPIAPLELVNALSRCLQADDEETLDMGEAHAACA